MKASNWLQLPDVFGYWWLKKTDSIISMVEVVPSKYYDETGGIEVWDCPGCGRYRLDSKSMPGDWLWQKVVPALP